MLDLDSSLQDWNMFDLVQLTWWPHCRQVRLASNLGVPDWQSSGRALKARRTWPGWSNINRRIVINKKCKTFNLHACFGFRKPTCAFPGYRTIVFRRPSTPEITPSRYFAVAKNLSILVILSNFVLNRARVFTKYRCIISSYACNFLISLQPGGRPPPIPGCPLPPLACSVFYHRSHSNHVINWLWLIDKQTRPWCFGTPNQLEQAPGMRK